MGYGIDLRRQVMRFINKGGSKVEAAILFGVARSRIYEWLKLDKSLSSGKKPGPKKATRIDEAALLSALKENPDALLRELAVRFKVDPSSIYYALKRLRVSRKKNVGLHRIVAPPKQATALSEALVHVSSSRKAVGVSRRNRL